MARTALQKVYADFRQGFVTVANPLAYPEGSLKDINNFDIKDNGTLRLRAGLRKETEDSFTPEFPVNLSFASRDAHQVYYWDNVGNLGEQEVAVVQAGRKIFLFEMLSSGINTDTPLKEITLNTLGGRADERISFTSGNGKLFASHSGTRPFYIEKTEDGFSDPIEITIEVRDFLVWQGASAEETGETKSDTMKPQHFYNLLNSGWPLRATVSSNENPDDGVVRDVDPSRSFAANLGYFPPIGYTFAAGRAGGGDTTEEQQAFTPLNYVNDYYDKSYSPKGKFVVPAESWARSATGAAITGTTTDFNGVFGTDITTGFAISTTGFLKKQYSWERFPSSIEFYAGRVWYAGAKGYRETVLENTGDYDEISDNINVDNTIYFSQQLDTDLNKIGKCYQENDPTVEDVNQLLATDGGTLSISGAGEILDIKTFGTSLIVFSKQGVWAVSGIDGNSFKATGFSVNKISNIGPTSRNTITSTGKTIYYIADDAVYVLSSDQITGLPSPQDITSGKIKDFYNSLSSKQKTNARLIFDQGDRLLYVLYSDVEEPDPDIVNLVNNKVLLFNQDTGAFTKYTLPVTDNLILDGIYYQKDLEISSDAPVVVDGEAVVVDGGAVAIKSSFSTRSRSNVQFLTMDTSNFNETSYFFSSFTDQENLQDFGEDYTGFVEFGFDSAGDILRDSKKSPVIITHMERTEDGFEEDGNGELQLTNGSSCFMSYGWDWASSYKNPQQIYRFNRHYIPSGTEDAFDYGVDVISTRNRIRGKGHSLGLRLDSESGKDCRILGIGILYTAARDV